MTSVAAELEIEIVPLDSVPSRVAGVRQELNQLSYGPSEVLVARRRDGEESSVLGAVRLAMRERPARPHGLIADLVVDQALRQSGVPERLITAAEARLVARGAQKIDAVTVDGRGWASFYYRCGYWSSRRTVVLTWNLAGRPAVEPGEEFEIRQVDHPDPDLIARFVLNSYQPYFRWWKEPPEDQRWDRVELQPEDEHDRSQQAAAEVRRHVAELVRRAGVGAPQTYFLAYKRDELIGLCDAKDAPAGEDTFDWCVLVSRHEGGKRLGSTLLDRALTWLERRGRATAEYTSTSGLDDYDPLIYLATVVTGAQIRGEFLNLVKNRLAAGVE